MTGPVTLDELGGKLGYKFRKTRLLDVALTHASLSDTRRHTETNERLEFLGDRVLGLLVAELLLEAFPDEAEGAIARRYADLVKRESLARVAGDLQLGGVLHLSAGEAATGGRNNPGVLADACEAILGAMYLDGGLEPARAFVRKHWTPMMQAWNEPPKDPKTQLQEWAQGRGLALPVYRMLSAAGPAHKPMFRIEVEVAGYPSATAEGPSKRDAERGAARALMQRLADGGRGLTDG
ncbi:MAG: ribonuclease III [Acetobacterales bacterium]